MNGQKPTYYLWNCLQWCEDILTTRAHYMDRGYQENLFINRHDLGLFACEKNGEQLIFARAGSSLPLQSPQLPETIYLKGA